MIMDELMKLAKQYRLNADDLRIEADCVEEYHEWTHIALMGYSAEMLRNAAAQLETAN